MNTALLSTFVLPVKLYVYKFTNPVIVSPRDCDTNSRLELVIARLILYVRALSPFCLMQQDFSSDLRACLVVGHQW